MSVSEIIIRNLRFGISRAPNPVWCDNNLIRTVQADALAIQIPPGERYFIRSLRRWESKLDDAHLVSEIRGYAKQEALHTREHEDYNDALRALGHDVDGMERQVERQLRIETPFISVAVTCAIEQITYSTSIVWLTKESGEGIAQPYKAMWTWHSIEEIEHAAVAIDVLNEITKDWSSLRRYGFRVGVFTHVFLTFLINWLRFGLRLQREREGKRTFKSVCRYFWVAFGSPGLVLDVIGGNLKYFKPGYRPDPAKNRDLLQQSRAALDVAVADMEHFFAEREGSASRAPELAAAQ
ncbi:MAG: metal-dependent hydrolase [Pseudomonadota bacterium]